MSDLLYVLLTLASFAGLAMLTGVIREAGGAARDEGAYLGWWNFATKLNLALAAGLALPALQWLGYAPGARDAAALQALTVAAAFFALVVFGLNHLARRLERGRPRPALPVARLRR